jgi:hypothetical protein
VVIDRYGAQTAYWVTSGCAFGAFLVGLIVFPSLRNALAGAETRFDRILAGNPAVEGSAGKSTGAQVITQVP